MTLDQMMDIPSRLSRNVAVADQTTFALLQPQRYQLPSPLHGVLPVTHKALLEVRLPFRRVWIGFCLYFGVSVDRNITCILQPYDVTLRRYTLKCPISETVGFKAYLPSNNSWQRYGLTEFHFSDTSDLGSAYPPVA